MARAKKVRTAGEVVDIRLAILHLKDAAQVLARARAPQAMRYVLAAKKSAEGAERHARNCLAPGEFERLSQMGIA